MLLGTAILENSMEIPREIRRLRPPPSSTSGRSSWGDLRLRGTGSSHTAMCTAVRSQQPRLGIGPGPRAGERVKTMWHIHTTGATRLKNHPNLSHAAAQVDKATHRGAGSHAISLMLQEQWGSRSEAQGGAGARVKPAAQDGRSWRPSTAADPRRDPAPAQSSHKARTLRLRSELREMAKHTTQKPHEVSTTHLKLFTRMYRKGPQGNPPRAPGSASRRVTRDCCTCRGLTPAPRWCTCRDGKPRVLRA